MSLVILAVFYLAFPALVIWACGRYSILDKVGAGILCYGVGTLMSGIGVVPGGAGELQNTFMTITVPLSIPLMLFSIDLKRWSRLAGKTFLSMVLMIIAVLAASLAGYILFRDSVEEAWKVAGMAIGVYTGGTANLNAIGLGLKAKEHVIVLTNTADMLACTPWFFFNMIFAQKLFNLFLPKFNKDGVSSELYSGDTEDEQGKGYEDDVNEINCYRGIFTRERLIPLSRAFFIAVLIFAAGGAAYSVVPEEFNMAMLMLVITTLALVCSFIPAIRNIKMTFQVGQYIVFIFCIVVGSMADIKQLFGAATSIILFISLVVYGSWIIHIILSALFRIDTDTVIITSVAAIFSPPFVPVFATALKNREIIVSGIAAGIVGYAMGNYLGISFAYFLKGFF